MERSPTVRLMLRLATAAILLFIYLPIALIVVYAFNTNRVPTWPPAGFTLEWFGRAAQSAEIRNSLALSIQAAVGATLVALVLGTLASFAVHRFAFFGRETVSFLVILPIALPGIVTGIALATAFKTIGVQFGLITIVVAHATFCVVTVYNNAIARLRRTSRSLEEASMDLGADTWQTFRYVTFPSLRTALLAGGLLAFALSFDEIIVTLLVAGPQQTLPIWIFNNYLRPNQAPVVNVVALLAIALSVIPVYLASRISSEAAGVPR
ncbi:MAG: ABC transporter permease [Chloroflexi bacterium]|nr:MAG: ABC transporter permease [Chloroflexota bacterium]